MSFWIWTKCLGFLKITRKDCRLFGHTIFLGTICHHPKSQWMTNHGPMVGIFPLKLWWVYPWKMVDLSMKNADFPMENPMENPMEFPQPVFSVPNTQSHVPGSYLLTAYGWWFFATRLKNMSSSVGMMILPNWINIWKVIKVMFQTTNQACTFSLAFSWTASFFFFLLSWSGKGGGAAKKTWSRPGTETRNLRGCYGR